MFAHYVHSHKPLWYRGPLHGLESVGCLKTAQLTIMLGLKQTSADSHYLKFDILS